MFSSLAGTVLLALLAAPHVSGHIELVWPPPLHSTHNPNTPVGSGDSTYTAPLSAFGTDYPCKGYLKFLGTSEGASVATFAPGGKYNFTLAGSAVHNGGSCQASLSYDQGKTFTVIQSYVGGCPMSTNYDFTVPSDAASGAALFAWSWFNNIGNREMYMNCASVTIGGGKKRELSPRDTAYSARPAMLAANIGNGCSTTENFDPVFPNPGPDVTTSSVAGHKFTAFAGNCGAAVATGSGGSSASATSATSAAGGGGAANAASFTTGATTSTTATTVTAATGTTAAGKASTTSTPGVFVSGFTTANGTATLTMASSAASSAASSTAKTTMDTSTTAAAAPPETTTAPAHAATSAAPPPTTTTPPVTGGASAGQSYTVGQACMNEGAWNCIDGKSFQRCASGMWSAVMSMASGTTCQVGVADTLTYARKMRARRWSLAGRRIPKLA